MQIFCWALAAACTWASNPPAVPPAAEAAYLRGAGLRKQAAALPSGHAGSFSAALAPSAPVAAVGSLSIASTASTARFAWFAWLLS